MAKDTIIKNIGRFLIPGVMALGTWLAGCSADNELGGVRIPNARPDTKITGQPPTLLEASFIVEFQWEGEDPDGRVVGFEYKISDNGLDGISVRDRSALTNNLAVGFISYKMFAKKEWRKADIYWGFDPYRFDHETSQRAIHWVLRYFGLQVDY